MGLNYKKSIFVIKFFMQNLRNESFIDKII